MAVLVTGVAGFIGAATSRALLERGTEVVGIDNLNDYYDPTLKGARLASLASRFDNRFRFERVDFANSEELRRVTDKIDIDSIVHLGAQAGVRYSLENPARIRSVEPSRPLQHAGARSVPQPQAHGLCVFVFGLWRQQDAPLSRRGPRRPSAIALRRHKKVRRVTERKLCEPISYSVDRPSVLHCHGPWGRPDMAMWIFTKALYSGEPLPLFNRGEMRRDFTYIDDIVRGVIACLDGPPADDGQVKAGGSISPHALYNIGNSRSEDLMRVVELLEQETGKTANRKPDADANRRRGRKLSPTSARWSATTASIRARADRRGCSALRRLVPGVSRGL